MLIAPICHIEVIDRDQLNRCLVEWGHKMGPFNRPIHAEWHHALIHNGQIVAVTAASILIRENCGGMNRDQAVELARMCACRPDLNRVMLRLWREFVLPGLCAVHGWTWAISYQDAKLHNGDLYRFDGWIRLGAARSGPDKRSGAVGRSKVVWGWCAGPIARKARAEEVKAAERERLEKAKARAAGVRVIEVEANNV